MNTSSMHIAVYGVIAATPPGARPQGTLPVRIKQYVKLRRDLLRSAYERKLTLDYRDYGGEHAYNVGDVAIAETIRRLFRAEVPECSFTNADWGDIQSLRPVHRNKPIDLLVVAGSGYFQFNQAGKLAAHVHDDLVFLKETGIPYVFYGIGINQPFSGERKSEGIQVDEASAALMRSLLAGASLISVRDEFSMRTLSSYTDKPVNLVGDPALHAAQVIDPGHSMVKEKSSPRIGLNFSFHGPTSNKLLLKNLSAYASALSGIQRNTGCRFDYIVHHGSEYPIPHLLKRKGVSLQIIHTGLTGTSRAYRNIDLHIGGMLHSCILSASAGTPWIAIAYDIKHRGFNQLMGLDDYYQDTLDFSESALTSLALESLRNRDALCVRIDARRLELRERIAQLTCSAVEGVRAT